MEKTFEFLDQYVTTYPTSQNAVDIFKGEWSSRFPAPFQTVAMGNIPLFEDSRIVWGLGQLGGAQDANVLELGPLEGGHSYMLEKAGAAAIVAIEANTRAYMKCLITKEILGLRKVRFLLGDFVEYLQHTPEKFDLCIASGVLYHMQNPIELIDLISQKTDKAIFWTHYFDEQLIAQNPHIKKGKFAEKVTGDYKGFPFVLHKQNYQEALGWGGFCGGSTHFSMWMPRASILACLQHFGFRKIDIHFEEPNHPNGPCFSLAVSR